MDEASAVELEELFKHIKGDVANRNFNSLLNKSYEMLEKAKQYNSKLYMARAYSHIGYCFYFDSVLPKALIYFEKSRYNYSSAIAKSSYSQEYAIVLNSLGILHKLEGDYLSSIKTLNYSLDYSERFKVTNSSAYSNIGTLYFNNQEYGIAKEYFEIAYDIATDPTENFKRKKFLTNKAHCCVKIGELNEAKKIYNKTLKYYEDTFDIEFIIATYKGLGEIAIQDRELSKAEKYFLKALETSKNKNFTFHYVDLLIDLAEIYSRTKRVREEEKILRLANIVAVKSNMAHYPKALERLQGFYERVKNYEMAELILKRRRNHLNSLVRREQQKEFIEFKNDFDEQMNRRFLNREYSFRKNLERTNRDFQIAVQEHGNLEFRFNRIKEQLLPDYIFNTLQSIQLQSIKGDLLAASDFVADFASLMRRVLKNSRLKRIRITDEMDLIDDYLRLEQRRFNNIFTYDIQILPSNSVKEFLIVPFVLQSFLKNFLKDRNEELFNTNRITMQVKCSEFFLTAWIVIETSLSHKMQEDLVNNYTKSNLENYFEQCKLFWEVDEYSSQVKSHDSKGLNLKHVFSMTLDYKNESTIFDSN